MDVYLIALLALSGVLNILVIYTIFSDTYLKVKLKRMFSKSSDLGILAVSFPSPKIGTKIIDFTKTEHEYRGGTYVLPSDQAIKSFNNVPFILYDSKNGTDPLPLNMDSKYKIKNPDTLSALILKIKALAETKSWLSGVNLIKILSIVSVLGVVITLYLSYTNGQKIDSLNSQVQTINSMIQTTASNFSVVVK